MQIVIFEVRPTEKVLVPGNHEKLPGKNPKKSTNCDILPQKCVNATFSQKRARKSTYIATFSQKVENRYILPEKAWQKKFLGTKVPSSSAVVCTVRTILAPK